MEFFHHRLLQHGLLSSLLEVLSATNVVVRWYGLALFLSRGMMAWLEALTALRSRPLLRSTPQESFDLPSVLLKATGAVGSGGAAVPERRGRCVIPAHRSAADKTHHFFAIKWKEIRDESKELTFKTETGFFEHSAR
jgi:hypothetical protein